MEKVKKPFQSQLSIAQRIGIMLKLEAIKTTLPVQGQRRVLLMSLFHFISENKIIQPGWLGTRIGKLRQCNQERTNFKHDLLQHLNNVWVL